MSEDVTLVYFEIKNSDTSTWFYKAIIIQEIKIVDTI